MINYFLTTHQETYNQAVKDIQSMPQFMGDAVNWGVDASYVAVGFMALLALGVSMFKR